MAKWKEQDYDPESLAAMLEKVKFRKPDGSISFRGFEHYEYTTLLESMVEVNGQIPALEKARIANEATFSAGAKGTISKSSLLREISRLESEYLARPQRRYTLVTSLSARRFFSGLRPVRISGCAIQFSDRLPKRFEQAVAEIRKWAKDWLVGKIPDDYTHVRVGAAARSYAAAVDKALDALDLIRAVWNLFWNRRRGLRISSGLRQPVNNLTLGPLHTLHEPDGRLATQLWWYDPAYTGPLRPHDPSKEMENLVKFSNHCRRLLSRSKYRSELETAVLRYTRALDLRNWEDAFLKLWGVLEHLTHTGSDSYRVTVRRASFLFDDQEYARHVLTCLRDYRNRAVHVGAENHGIETYLYQLKRFVEALIMFHIGNKYRFTSLAEAGEFMDLPCSESELRSKLRLLAYAQKFRSHK